MKKHNEAKDDTENDPMVDDSLLTVDEVSKWLRLSNKGTYGLVQQRKLPHLKLSNRLRFSRAEIVGWLQENRVPALEPKR
jgi:excisionase family DNA binding protein